MTTRSVVLSVLVRNTGVAWRPRPPIIPAAPRVTAITRTAAPSLNPGRGSRVATVPVCSGLTSVLGAGAPRTPRPVAPPGGLRACRGGRARALFCGRRRRRRGLGYGNLGLDLALIIVTGRGGIRFDWGNGYVAKLFGLISTPRRIPILGLPPREGELPAGQPNQRLAPLGDLLSVGDEGVLLQPELRHHQAAMHPNDGEARGVAHGIIPDVTQFGGAGLAQKPLDTPRQLIRGGLLAWYSLTLPVPRDQNRYHVGDTPPERPLPPPTGSGCLPVGRPGQIVCRVCLLDPGPPPQSVWTDGAAAGTTGAECVRATATITRSQIVIGKVFPSPMVQHHCSYKDVRGKPTDLVFEPVTTIQ